MHLRNAALRPAFSVPVAALLTALSGCAPDGPVEGPDLLPGPTSVQYPTDLWDLGVEGQTLLMLHVTAEGAVDSVYVHESSGFPQFDSAAIHGGRQMRFSPARRGGDRIDAWTRVPIRFQREAGRSDGAGGRETEPGGAAS